MSKKRKTVKRPKRKKKPAVLKLNIGAGGSKLPGFTPIDCKDGQKAYPLKHKDNSVDEIYASHILEHFDVVDAGKALMDWVRVLKPGGRIRLAVPNLAWICGRYHHKEIPPNQLVGYLMGGQTDDNDYHKSVFDEFTLRRWMASAGLERVTPWESEIGDCASLPVSLNLQGYKTEPRKSVDIPKIAAIMSTARLAFTENLFCAMSVFEPRRIGLIKHTGAYWGQCLERVMKQAIDSGVEWIVTLDYDTVFDGQTFDELCYLLATHPEADAIAPWQMKREEYHPFLWLTGDGVQPTTIPLTMFDPPLTEVQSAHFGLTLIRVAAIRDLPKPWFWAQPNKDNEWGDGRIDDDIYFWNQFRKHGKRLFMANHVCIGHLQQIAVWPDQNLQPSFQYLTEFHKQGPPEHRRQ